MVELGETNNHLQTWWSMAGGWLDHSLDQFRQLQLAYPVEAAELKRVGGLEGTVIVTSSMQLLLTALGTANEEEEVAVDAGQTTFNVTDAQEVALFKGWRQASGEVRLQAARASSAVTTLQAAATLISEGMEFRIRNRNNIFHAEYMDDGGYEISPVDLAECIRRTWLFAQDRLNLINHPDTTWALAGDVVWPAQAALLTHILRLHRVFTTPGCPFEEWQCRPDNEAAVEKRQLQAMVLEVEVLLGMAQQRYDQTGCDTHWVRGGHAAMAKAGRVEPHAVVCNGDNQYHDWEYVLALHGPSMDAVRAIDDAWPSVELFDKVDWVLKANGLAAVLCAVGHQLYGWSAAKEVSTHGTGQELARQMERVKTQLRHNRLREVLGECQEVWLLHHDDDVVQQHFRVAKPGFWKVGHVQLAEVIQQLVQGRAERYKLCQDRSSALQQRWSKQLEAQLIPEWTWHGVIEIKRRWSLWQY
jgi:hypothetical protein